jgi:hypothetical protein
MAPVAPTMTPRRRGRRIAFAVYYAVVAAVSIAGATQITQQVLLGPTPGGPYPSCQEGLRALYDAVIRARDDAAKTDQGEDAALARFRSALEPEWRYRDDIASRCRDAPRDKGALDAIERLRYAEEHAVRREAGELAPLRRRVQAIVDRDLPSPPTVGGTPRAPAPAGAPTLPP